MDPAPGLDFLRTRKAVLRTALVIGVLLATYLLIAAQIAHEGINLLFPAGAVAISVLVAAIELLREARTERFLIVSAVTFSGLELWSEASSRPLVGTGPGSLLSLLVLLAILFTCTRSMAARWPVAVFSACIFAFSITSVLLEQPPVSQAVALIAIGGPGQALALGIMVHFIARLAATAARDEQRAAMQQALALCSHELLAHRDEAGIPKALTALLGATEAGYAYVDVNRTDSDGRVTWEIVHSAEGPNNPEGPGEFGKGDYDELPWVVEELGKGCPTQVTVAHLTGSVRQRYEREGIRSELMAPIMIDGNWVGTIGFSDFRRDGAWTELETNALVRAADMIGACWERDRAREGLEELAKAKDRFIAAISHELRTPLSAVVGFSAALASGVNDFSTAEVQEMAEMISRQSRDVSDLVEDLLTSERAASGNLTMCFDWVDLGAEVRAVTELLPEPPQVLPHPPVTVWADGLRVRQVIRNLLTNAGRYGGPQVQVAIDKFERNARLAVIDDGNGVTKVDQDRIFDPYYRSRSDVAVPDSVGLGLAVARQLARLMHGDLVYVRRQGLTRFELILPLAANPQARAGELDEEPRRRSRNRSRAAVIARF